MPIGLSIGNGFWCGSSTGVLIYSKFAIFYSGVTIFVYQSWILTFSYGFIKVMLKFCVQNILSCGFQVLIGSPM